MDLLDKYPGIMIRIFLSCLLLTAFLGQSAAQKQELDPLDIQTYGVKSVQIETFKPSEASPKILREDHYLYDWEGRVAKRRQKDFLHHLGTEAVFKYDRKGNKIYHAIQLDHSGVQEKAQWLCTYEGGRLVMEESPVSSLKRFRYYNDLGQLSRMETWFDNDFKISEEKYYYDGHGQLIREINNMDFIQSVSSYAYDRRGNRISAKQETQYFAEGKPNKFVHEVYLYNRYQQVVRSQRLDRSGSVLSTVAYEYNPSGRLQRKIEGDVITVFERDARGLITREVVSRDDREMLVKSYVYKFWGAEAAALRTKP